MAKPIIGGPDTNKPQAPRATNGGQQSVKPTSYSPPVGPKDINSPNSPGLHGANHGNCVMQGKH